MSFQELFQGPWKLLAALDHLDHLDHLDPQLESLVGMTAAAGDPRGIGHPEVLLLSAAPLQDLPYQMEVRTLLGGANANANVLAGPASAPMLVLALMTNASSAIAGNAGCALC